MELLHKFSSEQKLAWWGYGEWVEEPEIAHFVYKGLPCSVSRVVYIERESGKDLVFGGHFSGTVYIPENHHWVTDGLVEIESPFRHDFSFALEGNKASFDCGQTMDIVPSVAKMGFLSGYYIDLPDLMVGENDNYLIDNQPTYKNINFCIEECKNLVNLSQTSCIPK